MGRKKATAFAFLDTNIFLQFRDFDQIDWLRELGYQQVCLVIAPIIFAELESFKYDRDSQRRRERSRKVSQHLEQIASSCTAGSTGTRSWTGRRGNRHTDRFPRYVQVFWPSAGCSG